MPPEQSRILQLAWLPRSRTRQSFCGPSFLAGWKSRHERAWSFLEAQQELGWVLPGSASAKWAGRRHKWAQIREIRTGMPGDSVLWGE